MHLTSLLSLSSLLPLLTTALPSPDSSASTSSTGSAIVQNKCPFPVYLWSVGSSVGPRQTLAANTGSYSEVFHRDPSSGGMALKITTTPDGLYDGSPQTTYAYTLDADGQRVWYDLSDTFGDAFKGHPLKLSSSDGACRGLCWSDGVPPAGSQTRDCGASASETLVLCAAGC